MLNCNVIVCIADMSQSVHFDAIMKTSDWQLKAQRGQMKTAHLVRTVELTEDVEVEASAKQRPLLEQPKRRYIRRNLGLTPNLSDSKLLPMIRLWVLLTILCNKGGIRHEG